MDADAFAGQDMGLDLVELDGVCRVQRATHAQKGARVADEAR